MDNATIRFNSGNPTASLNSTLGIAAINSIKPTASRKPSTAPNPITTKASKIIFGGLYQKLGSESFYKSVKISDTDEDMRIIIQQGIRSVIKGITTQTS